MRTSSRSLAVILFDEVALLDISAPLEVLTTAGRNWNFRPFKIFTVAAAAGRIKTPCQIELTANGSFESCPERTAESVFPWAADSANALASWLASNFRSRPAIAGAPKAVAVT